MIHTAGAEMLVPQQLQGGQRQRGSLAHPCPGEMPATPAGARGAEAAAGVGMQGRSGLFVADKSISSWCSKNSGDIPSFPDG